MAQLKENRLAAASLVEATVAMVIMVLIFTTALAIYLRVTAAGTSLSQIRYRLALAHYAQETRRQRSFLDETRTLEAVQLQKEVRPYRGNPRVLQVQIRLVDESDSVLAVHQELIYVPHATN